MSNTPPREDNSKREERSRHRNIPRDNEEVVDQESERGTGIRDASPSTDRNENTGMNRGNSFPSLTTRPDNWASMSEQQQQAFNRQRNIIYLQRSRQRRSQEKLETERQFEDNEKRMQRLEGMVHRLTNELLTDSGDERDDRRSRGQRSATPRNSGKQSSSDSDKEVSGKEGNQQK